MDHERNRQTG